MKIEIIVYEAMVNSVWTYQVSDSKKLFESVDGLSRNRCEERVNDMRRVLKEIGYNEIHIVYY